MSSEYDLAVIGGGINGAGIARDAASRGLKVIVLEKNDFGSGTTSWSSRLIHGGLRYLEYGEIPLVFESLRERRRLRELAPHLVSSLKLTIPVYRGSRRGRWLIRLGMLAYDVLSLGKKTPRHRMLSRDELLHEMPRLRSEGLVGGAQYFDAQVTFAERLVIENVLAAHQAGAVVRNYSPVIGINVRQHEVHSLQFVDQVSGEEQEVRARVIINAAGPWVDRVLATVNREMQLFMGGTRGSHIVVGRFEGAPETAFYIEADADHRPLFIIPWNGQVLIGTTDIRHEGDPGEARASQEEIDYLLAESNRVFPSADLAMDDIHYVYAGIRPLPRREKGPESAITRKHIILHHKKLARGLLSVIGGKLTTYRNLAEQAVNKVVRLLDIDAGPCRTRTEALPGGADLQAARDKLIQNPSLNPRCVERLLAVYGSRALRILEMKNAPQGFVDKDERVLAAEIVYAMREEFAVTLTDIIFRRTMIGLDPDQGAGMFAEIARLAGAEAGWDSSEMSRQHGDLEEFCRRLQPAATSGPPQ